MQRRANKLVENVKDLHYDEMLNILGLMRLDKRRDKSDLIETFMILNGNYRVDNFFSLYQMMVAGEDTPESYLKDCVDWILKKISFSNRIVDN